jgi:ethanolamine utilization protein EutN
VIVAKVVGRVVATRKDEGLVGSKLLIIRPLSGPSGFGENLLVAVDTVGAGIGEEVLVATGSAARLAEGLDGKPIDAAIVGIIDSKDL